MQLEGGVVAAWPSSYRAPFSPSLLLSSRTMDLPSSRELELEAALRQRDAQVQELTDEVSHLRQYLCTQPGPSTTDPVTLPPALVSLLLPHINATSSAAGATSGSSTVTAALTQRAKLLQEENDELYELLQAGETGKLKEEARGLRRAVGRLETALRESHQVIRTLSEELEKSYDTVLSTGRQHNHVQPHPHAAARPHHQLPPHIQSNGNGSAKPVPTGPRAHKKPRLSEPRASPSNSPTTLPRLQTQSTTSSSRHIDSPERSPLLSPDHRKVPAAKAEADDDQRTRPRSPAPAPERDRPRERDRNRDRDRDRGRDRDRSSRRNGHGHGRKGRNRAGGGGGGGGADGESGDRTLAQRMGLGHN